MADLMPVIFVGHGNLMNTLAQIPGEEQPDPGSRS
jgi:hypothetical protein